MYAISNVRRKHLEKRMRKFLFFLVCLAILAFVTRLFFNSFLKEMPVEQILWHLQNPMLLKGAGRESFLNTHYMLILGLYLFLAWLFFYGAGIIYRLLVKIGLLRKEARINNALKRLFHFLRLAAGYAAIIYLFSFTPWFYQIYKFYFGPQETAGDFIAENYYVPAPEDISFPDGKNNLVIILAESMENAFAHLPDHPSLIPNLQKLRETYAGNDNFFEVHGAGWTIAAETGWFFGLPLKLPNRIHQNDFQTRTGFLPGAISVFDVLADHGYICVALCGHDKHFSATDKLFEHGDFDFRDKIHFQSMGFSLATYEGLKEWGYRDSFIFGQGLVAYDDLIAGDRPFVLFIKTVNTHFPNGYCPQEKQKYGDIRDAFANSDSEISDFVEKLLSVKKKRDRLVICIIGDHNYMAKLPYLEKMGNRTLYNVFIGKNVPELALGKKTAYTSALDMAPTLLQLAGARWKNSRFGLGSSLFSTEPSIAEKFGLKAINENLAKKSDFYSRLYYKN